MSTTIINNQAVKLYTPSETLFNDTTDPCVWHLNYSQLVTCDDTTEIILNNSIVDSNILNDSTMSYLLTGSTSSTSFKQLIDAAQDFVANNVVVGMYARNEADDTTAKILTVLSGTNLQLDTDIFTATPKDYSISWWNLSGNVSITAASITKTTGAVASIKQDGLVEGNVYQIKFDLVEFSSTTNGHQINIKVGGTTILTLDEANAEIKTHIAYGKVEGVSPDEFEITIDSDIGCKFANIEVSRMSNVVFFVFDCDTQLPVYTSLISDIETSSVLGQVKASFDWSNLNSPSCDGCYDLRLIDDVSVPKELVEERINNNGITDAGAWVFGTDWGFTGAGAQIITASGAGDLDQTDLLRDFSKSLSYDVTFTVSSYVDGVVNVFLYKGAVMVSSLGFVVSNGTHTLSSGILTSDADTIKFSPSAFSNHYVLKDVFSSMNHAHSRFDFRTNCFSLSDSFDCTVKLNGTNSNNAFGIDFNGINYNPFIRVLGQLETAKYVGEKENEEDSSGINTTLYFKSEKVRNLFIYQQPEFIHDFLRLLKGYDAFLVDGVEYVSTNPDYEASSERVAGRISDLTNVTFEVRLKNDLNENKFC